MSVTTRIRAAGGAQLSGEFAERVQLRSVGRIGMETVQLGDTIDDFTQAGVLDFDGAVFKGLWDDPARSEEDLKAYVRYYLSDHRPLWAEFITGAWVSGSRTRVT